MNAKMPMRVGKKGKSPMKTFVIRGVAGDSTIYTGASFKKISDFVPSPESGSPMETVVVTDHRVWELYKDAFPPFPTIKTGQGEKIKTLSTIEYLYDEFKRLGVHRQTFIMGVGGGIVCDIVGFAASTYLRGLRFGLVPTTLLAQADASMGGKNGVNFHGYKNLIGTFNQPEFVMIDPGFAKTLPKKEILCAMAEIVKHAAIMDHEYFSFIDAHYQQALALDNGVIKRLIHDSAAIKSAIVNADAREKGERKKLNFGHTFGHAIEKTTAISHGQAVSVGMALAAKFSVEKGFLAPEDAARLSGLLQKTGRPTALDLDKERVLEALKKDKKRDGDAIDFVFLTSLGNAAVKRISLGEARRFMDGNR